ncbi:MAG: hypothetical protein EOP20_00660 [Hyphomicrobiales bacterium]|nr:MAG: hypothetical protein EOP20_00660 [Hyphomicrobiales bacterium]
MFRSAKAALAVQCDLGQQLAAKEGDASPVPGAEDDLDERDLVRGQTKGFINLRDESGTLDGQTASGV